MFGATEEEEGWRLSVQAWLETVGASMGQEGWRSSDPLWFEMKAAFFRAFQSGKTLEIADDEEALD